jgi:hypothetical protein
MPVSTVISLYFRPELGRSPVGGPPQLAFMAFRDRFILGQSRSLCHLVTIAEELISMRTSEKI